MLKSLQKVLARPHVAAVDDERKIGNSIIVMLEDDYCFKADPGCGTRGFDSVKECEMNTRADDVYKLSETTQKKPAPAAPLAGREILPAGTAPDADKALQGLYLCPTLEHDTMMQKEYRVEVGPRGHLERRIVWNLCLYMQTQGFEIHSVYDGDDEPAKRPGLLPAMNLIFNLDEISLRFIKKGYTWHGVLIILGNGIDCISDWNYHVADHDGFNAAMHKFAFDNLQNWK